MSTKREQLEHLDELLLKKMTKALDGDDWEAIKCMGTVSTYLKNNQVITPPAEEGTMHDKVKDIME